MSWRLVNKGKDFETYHNSDGGTLEIGDWRSGVDGESFDVVINRDSKIYVSEQPDNIIHTASNIKEARVWAKKWMFNHPKLIDV